MIKPFWTEMKSNVRRCVINTSINFPGQTEETAYRQNLILVNRSVSQKHRKGNFKRNQRQPV
jgi:hypothetical protein